MTVATVRRRLFHHTELRVPKPRACKGHVTVVRERRREEHTFQPRGILDPNRVLGRRAIEVRTDRKIPAKVDDAFLSLRQLDAKRGEQAVVLLAVGHRRKPDQVFRAPSENEWQTGIANFGNLLGVLRPRAQDKGTAIDPEIVAIHGVRGLRNCATKLGYLLRRWF